MGPSKVRRWLCDAWKGVSGQAGKNLAIACVGMMAALSELVAVPSGTQFRADTILSVLQMNDVVFVSTRAGLFQSSVSQQKWRAVKLPKGVLAGGCLNVSDAGVTRIYYSPPVRAVTERNDRCAIGFGLWMSADLGKTWKKVDATHYFRSVLTRKDGVLYASVRQSPEEARVGPDLELAGGLPLVSTDGGKTWVNTFGDDPIPLVLYLFTCRKNPAHVCAKGLTAREFDMEYAPENKKWTFERSVGGNGMNDLTAEEFLGPGEMNTGTSGCCPVQQATLENYYLLGFGDVLQRVGVTLRAEKKRYEFSGGNAAKVVDVSLNLLPGVPGTSAMAVLDLEETEICWGLRYVDPEGGKHEVVPVITRLNNPAVGRAHLMEVGRPYQRQIDLQGLEELGKPGVYRMVLVFDNQKLKKKDENEWTGRIVGMEEFEVEIK